MRILCAALVAVVVGIQQPRAEPFTFTPDTVVRIDVSAFDARGRFVDKLSAADFELREDGQPQTIDAVRLVRSAGGGAGGAAGDVEVTAAAITSESDEQAEAQRPGARLFAIYLDEYHVSPGEPADRVREALTRFVDREIGPRDLVVVMKPLDSLLAIRLSHDRDAARAAIASFAGRKGDYTARNEYEQNYMASTPAAIAQTRSQVALSALNALAVHLGWASPDARKTLIVVSEGLAHVGRRRGLSLPTLESIVRSADRFNVSVYPVDPSGEPPADGEADEADALRTLASETDGRAVFSDGDLDPAFGRIAADASAYYLITYRSPKKIDGHFHEIQLRVKRRGVQLRSRKGYWASSPDDLLRAEFLAREALPKKPVVLEPPRHLSPLILPWFGSERGAAGKTRVTFVWEPVRAPGDRRTRVAARVELTALGEDDAPVFQGAVLPTGGSAADGPDAKVRAVFEVPPGRLRLRMSIEDAGRQVIDSDVRDVSIRNLAKTVVLGTPEVLRARTARDFKALESDPNAAPVAAREFSRTERLLIRVSGYGPGADRPTISARLLSRFGQPVRDLAVEPPRNADGPSQIDLPLAGFAVGEYSLELTATSKAGEAKDLVGFRITS